VAVSGGEQGASVGVPGRLCVSLVRATADCQTLGSTRSQMTFRAWVGCRFPNVLEDPLVCSVALLVPTCGLCWLVLPWAAQVAACNECTGSPDPACVPRGCPVTVA